MSEAKELVESWNRKWRTLWVWSQLYIGYKAAQVKGRLLQGDKRDAYWERKHSHLAESVWSNISELRGWWVKVGQFLSTRSDLIPTQYVKQLAKLQDMMPTSDIAIVKKIVEDELGAPVETHFEDFSEKAIASASIGQVHTATLKKTGEKVVVKVQHPGVDKTLRQDMALLTQMTWAFGLLEKGLNFTPILDEWQKNAANELDFRLEAQNQESARIAAEKAGLKVIIPRCHFELTTQRVLVMEYIEGFKVTDLHQLQKYSVDVNQLMQDICMAFAHQIHIDGLFNGDPHPGNILVQIREPNNEAIPVLLDWGLVKAFNYEEKVAFARAIYSVANLDVMGLMAAFEDMGFSFKTGSSIDPEVYMDALRIGFFRDAGEVPSAHERESAAAAIKNSNITKEDIIQNNPIDNWPKDIIFFIRVASLLHGLSLQLQAKVPFLEILVRKAEECLVNQYIPKSPAVYYTYQPSSFSRKTRCILEWRVHQFLQYLYLQKHLLLGCQVAIYKKGHPVVDTCIGQMGPTNAKPVTRSSLFCAMGVSVGLLVTALLNAVATKQVCLDDAVCNWWDGFIRFNKNSITIRDVLSHRAGLHNALPEDLRLSQLVDYDTMVACLENATPTEPRGKNGGRYAFLTCGWLLSELTFGISGIRIDEYIRSHFIQRFGLQNEMYFPLPEMLPWVTSGEESTSVGPKCPPVDFAQFGPESKGKEAKAKAEVFKGAEDKRSAKAASPSVNVDQEKRPQSLKEEAETGTLYGGDADSEGPKFSKFLNQRDQSFTRNIQRLLPEFSLARFNPKPSEAATAKNSTSLVSTTSEKPTTRLTKFFSFVQPQSQPETSMRGITGLTSSPEVSVDPPKSPPDTEDEDRVTSLLQFVEPSAMHNSGLDIHSQFLKPSPSPPDRTPFEVHSTEGSPKPGMVRLNSLIECCMASPTSGRHPPFVKSLSPVSVQSENHSASKELNPVPAVAPSTLRSAHETVSAESPPCVASKPAEKSVIDILRDRLVTSKRQVKGVRITADEVNAKLLQAQEYAGSVKSEELEPFFAKFPSKYLHKISTLRAGTQQGKKKPKLVSPIEIAHTKPHVMDPLIYDSRRIQHLLIPGTNCRTTARALAKFYAALGAGKIMDLKFLKQAAMPCLVDKSVDTFILTGASSPIWGLGYQLFPVVETVTRSGRDSAQSPTFANVSSTRRVNFDGPTEFPGSLFEGWETTTGMSTDIGSQRKTYMGLGHGDIAGNIAFCIPELELSIAILLNDILTGPIAAKEILVYILSCVGLAPAWDSTIPVSQVASVLKAAVDSASPSSNTSSIGFMLNEETEYPTTLFPFDPRAFDPQ